MSVRIEASTVDDLLNKALQHLFAKGEPRKATRGDFCEVIGPTFVLTNPRARLSRSESRSKVFSAIGELFWYLSKANELDYIDWFVPDKYQNESADKKTVRSGYGNRLFNWRGIDQVQNVIDLLSRKPSSRQAVIQIIDADDVDSEEDAIPCTCTLQFLLRDGQLHLLVSMRSNDTYLGFPHDIFAFTMLQELIARTLNVELGTYLHTVGSFHLYDKHIEGAGEYLREGFQNIVPMAPMPMGDPWNGIKEILEFEAGVRVDPFAEIPAMDPYWADICRLLAIYSLTKLRPAGALAACEQIAGAITNKAYGMFIDARVSKLRDSNV
ncbi:thymidylate synthase [Lacisediminimonas profundi]|uniref:thymidylate synthase n=1 Tax=Lacisediminimonas profundi TaxID=2603856 RepID=UPI00124B9211|nr:thymidylate synthase [Lacisediminimonas profundi]